MSWRTRVPGSNRIGTIPFMALDLLLEKYGEEVTRCYYHELEAFIWMLPFVFLAYDNGKLDPKNLFIKSWITSDYITCGEKKLAFVAPERLADALFGGQCLRELQRAYARHMCYGQATAL